jgi:two-component system cell cycle sensor histidine kinase/response regulator CckA
MSVAELLRPEYEGVFNAVPGNYLLLDNKFTIRGASDAWLSAMRMIRGDVVGRSFFDVFPDKPQDPITGSDRILRESLQRVLAIGRPNRLLDQRYDIHRPGGEDDGLPERFWNLTNAPILGRDGKVAFIIHSAEDVTELVQLKQKSLRADTVEFNQHISESERRYRFLANALPQLIWTADPSGLIDYCNDRWLAFTGLLPDRIHGTAWHQLVHPEDRERTIEAWSHAVRTGADRYQMEHRLHCRNETWRWVLSSATPYRDAAGVIHTWLGTTTDIHDRVTAEEQLRQAQRLQAVGILAGGMAHEVNNMMSVVMGFGELVLAAIAKDHPQRADIAEMVRAGARATAVTRQLLAFSRQQVLKPIVVDANVVITELTHAIVRLLGSDRRLEVVPSRTPLRVVTDRVQIEQVLINLVLNARDATSSGDTIVIETSAVELDDSSLPAVEGEPGDYVRLVVRDDGVGMSPDVVARAVEPFFTTKAPGQGTGLGLSMVHGVLKQCGGQVQIESVPGEGTVVSVYLPRAEVDVTPAEPFVAAVPASGETVLVVEDEAAVRSLARRVLEGQGYTVYQAPNAATALDFVAEHPREIDLLLTDIMMPGMNGVELAEKIAERDPGLPVLFMSGYSKDELIQRGISLSSAAFIPKPIPPEVLATAVRELLAHARTSTTA